MSLDCERELIDRFIRSVGGYWPPLGALARACEELGELSDALISGDTEGQQDELVDLFVTVGVVANHYCIWPTLEEISKIPAHAEYGRLASSCGRLARLVNAYEGIKPTKDSESLDTGSSIIARIYAELFAYARALRFDLRAAVQSSVASKADRDRDRFAKNFHPITALAVDAYRELAPAAVKAEIPAQNMWGAPQVAEIRSSRELLSSTRLHAERFLRISAWAPISAFVWIDHLEPTAAARMAESAPLSLWRWTRLLPSSPTRGAVVAVPDDGRHLIIVFSLLLPLNKDLPRAWRQEEQFVLPVVSMAETGRT